MHQREIAVRAMKFSAQWLRAWISLPLSVALLLQFWPTTTRADKLSLQDGRIIEGRLSQLNSMQRDPGLAPANAATKGLVLMLDDDLRHTYISNKWVQHVDPAPVGQHWEEINVEQPVATGGQRISGVGTLLRIEPWDKDPDRPGFGRRLLTMTGGPLGHLDIVQGITKITPIWCKVEGLQMSMTPSFIWDMRIATTSIPQDKLANVINRQIDPKKIDDRVKVVRLYLQMDRYKEAEAELKQVIQDFPARKDLDDVVRQLQQFRATQLLQEMDTRGKAGQYRLAYSGLQQFPHDGVDGEILRKARAKLDEYNELNERGQKILKQLTELTEKLPDKNLQNRADAIVKEIKDELSAHTLDRMATYRRFADDDQPKPETKLALAISGWLAGAGSADEKLEVALSMFEVRNLVRQFLKETDKVRRDTILKSIQAQEASSPKSIADLVKHMVPCKETASQSVPGFFELSVPGLPGEAEVPYCVQLPPEYDSHASYPCILALHGAGTAKQEIDWWAGELVQKDNATFRVGQATRYGYIVVAPHWTKPHQGQFDGTAREHDAVLSALRDACRRFAIDTDRVFLSGHSVGGDAAWEIGLSHPDLWAGVIPIVPTANKIVEQYWKNAEYVPLYFVCGELDGTKWEKNSVQFDRYMNRSAAFDCTVVEFEGRGHEHFSDEILRLFDWMGRKQRNFFPKHFETSTQRAWDNYFWWLEMQGFQPKGKNEIQSTVTATNGVSVQCGGRITVWLSPEMVDFSKPINVSQYGKAVAPSKSIQADVATLLEDVRTRGDRKHPFWAKVE